jgi:hypothetical protein
MFPRALCAAAAAVCALACNPSGSDAARTPAAPDGGASAPTGGGAGGGGTTTPAGGDGSGGTGGQGGGGGAGGAGSGDGGGGQGSGGAGGGLATAWATKMGGKGVELVQDVVAAPDGSLVVLNVIGVSGDTVQQVGFVRHDASGHQTDARAFDAPGAALRFPAAGAVAAAPSGDLAVAFTCAGGCPALLGATASGAAVVSFTAAGDPRWVHAGSGEVVTNPAAGPGGDVAFGLAASGGTVIRRLAGGDGTVRWDRPAPGLAAGAALAMDGDGNVVYSHGDHLAKLDAAGAPVWDRAVGFTVTALRAVGTTLVAAGLASGDANAATVGADGSVAWTHGLGAADGVAPLLAVDGAGRSAVVTHADGCGATVAELDASGAQAASRPLAAGGCGGRALVVHGVAWAPSSVVALGGALSAAVDFGTGPVAVQATDGFLAALSP